MPAAVAVPAIMGAVGAGTSLLGGVLGSRAAGKAANLQYQSTQQAQQLIQKLLSDYNPEIGRQGTVAQQGVLEAGKIGSDRAMGAAAQANDMLWPYRSIGMDAATSLADLMVPGGEFNRNFTANEVLAQDPGYQFRMDEAQKALEKSAAAKGGLLGGGTGKALSKYIGNLASSEYGSAFERLRESQGDRFSRLNTLLGLGYNASGQAGGNLINANQYGGTLQYNAANAAGNFGMTAAEQEANNAMNAGRSLADLITGGGAARAAGTVGSANAWTGALGGVANAAGQVGRYYTDQNILEMLRNPAAAGGGAGAGGGFYNLPSPQAWSNPALIPGGYGTPPFIGNV